MQHAEMKNSVSWVIDATPYVDMSIFTVFLNMFGGHVDPIDRW